MEESYLVNDCFIEISKHIDTGSTWKSWILVCREFASMNSKKQIHRFSNHITTLLSLYPAKPWDWYGLSCNPNITWDIVQANPEKPWYW